ncbi:hypothetical protein K3495_g14002 [Podosphaera aphanis]|nr:hypothetical protein K3495_g14002 [Podosphaera aphanis]
MASREESIQSALDKLNSGFYSSLRSASRAYKIPRSTLRARLAGSQSHTIAHRNQQRLKIDQEESLAKWILDEDFQAHPPSHARVREMASLILQANGDNAPLGKNWMTSFLQRQTNVHTVVGKSIKAVRATAGNQETIRSFFEVFSQTVLRLNIKTENIWNMDETGLALGVCSNSRVLSSSLKHKAYVKSPNTREWVSIIETASGSGRRLRPAVIFKGQSLQTSWFPP